MCYFIARGEQRRRSTGAAGFAGPRSYDLDGEEDAEYLRDPSGPADIDIASIQSTSALLFSSVLSLEW